MATRQLLEGDPKNGTVKHAAPPPCYCITGHGRSGTSMIAALLQSGGLNIGRRLMGAFEGNPRGHFEDLDFYDFHVAVLTALGLGSEGYVLEPALAVNEQFLPTARSLVQTRRQRGRSWGWKDPRTTLFLDFWRELVPEARFLLLFRAPWEVADSMFRRGDSVFLQNPALAVKVWLNYNRAILDFHARFPERCLLIESHAAAVAPLRLTEAIASRFGDHFGPVGNLFDKELFRHDATCHARGVLGHFFPEALQMYEELRARAILVLPGQQEAAVSSHHGAEDGLRYWVNFRVAEKDAQRTRVELDGARVEISRLQGAFASMQREVTSMQREIASMQESKFWKLRRLCLRARHSLSMSQWL